MMFTIQDYQALVKECEALRAKLAASVPVEDVRPLVEMLQDGTGCGPTERYRLIADFCAKYPNLFTK